MLQSFPFDKLHFRRNNFLLRSTLVPRKNTFCLSSDNYSTLMMAWMMMMMILFVNVFGRHNNVVPSVMGGGSNKIKPGKPTEEICFNHHIFWNNQTQEQSSMCVYTDNYGMFLFLPLRIKYNQWFTDSLKASHTFQIFRLLSQFSHINITNISQKWTRCPCDSEFSFTTT